MKDVLVLRNIECIRAVAHPKRIEILKQFKDEPLSAKQLSEKLEEPHAKVNYHIKMLYKVGILELVEEKIKSGIVEKYYYPAARNIEVAKSVLNFSLAGKEESDNEEYVSIFEGVSEAFFDAAEAGRLNSASVEDYHDIKLSESEANELKEALQTKINEILSRENREDNGVNYEVALVSIPE